MQNPQARGVAEAESILRAWEDWRDYDYLNEINGPKCATKQVRQLRRYRNPMGPSQPDRWPIRRFGKARKGAYPWTYPLGIPDMSNSMRPLAKYPSPSNLRLFPGAKSAQSTWTLTRAAAKGRRQLLGGRQQNHPGRPRKAA